MPSRRAFARGFCHATAGMALWRGLTDAEAEVDSASQAASNLEQIPITDTHVHLWSRKDFDLAWIKGRSQLDRDFTLADYRREVEGLPVTKALYMEVDVGDANLAREADLVLSWCEAGENPLVGAVIGGRPADEQFPAYLDRFRGREFLKGVRQVLHGSAPAGFCLTPQFIKGMKALGDRGLSFDLCLRPGELPDAEKLCRACPETTFILDHCGNARAFWDEQAMTSWRNDMKRLSQCDNVGCKVSGIIASTQGRPWKPADLAPIVDWVLDSFGENRVVFGGDWPVCTLGAPLRHWIQTLQGLVAGRSTVAQKKLFAENAKRLYRLE